MGNRVIWFQIYNEYQANRSQTVVSYPMRAMNKNIVFIMILTYIPQMSTLYIQDAPSVYVADEICFENMYTRVWTPSNEIY